MALVTDVIAVRRGSKRRMIELDHAEWRETSAEVLAPLGVRPGLVMPEQELAAAIDGEEPVRARDRALRLLAYRERTSTEIRERLGEDGYPPDVVRDTVDSLERTGLLDDERFARMMARILTRTRGMGRSRALHELESKGVDGALARDALDEALPPEDEIEAAAALARAHAARPGATRDRVAARLVRKGYGTSIALRAARDATESFAGDQSPDDVGWDSDEPADLREGGA